jgi:hypothetical protein
MPISFDITEKDHDEWLKECERLEVDNHPLRKEGETFFDAMLSDEADITKHGFLSQHALASLKG